MQKQLPVLVLVLAFMLSGCGAIFHGSNQTIAVSTDPPDAQMKIGGNTLKSPASVTLRRDADYIITAEKDGYDAGQGTIQHSVHWGTTLGNIIFGGLIGLAIDFGSGSAYKLEPQSLVIPLKAKVANAGSGSPISVPGAIPSPGLTKDFGQTIASQDTK
jgi:hypothetical protein